MKSGTVQSLIDILEQAFRQLGLVILSRELENLAFTVHKSMSGEGRMYHTPEHVLSLANPDNPIQTLAALFHDIVYYQVDQTFAPEALVAIAPYTYLDGLNDGRLTLRDPADLDSFFYHAALNVFGFAPGQNLFASPGSNEFLSTLVMVDKLRHLLPVAVILQVMVYIEATIPFREADADGRGPFDILEMRLRSCCQEHAIAMDEAAIESTLRGAVIFANKDVDNFADKDPAIFLSSTMKLLPEVNLALRSASLYLIRDYREALERMQHFLKTLRPENVFHSYHGVPSEAELQEYLKYTRINMETAHQYLDLKLLTVGILEALAQATGGDAPLSLFLGDTAAVQENARRLEDYLPEHAAHPQIDQQAQVYKLLNASNGNLPDLAELKNSRLTLFIYCYLGPQGTAQHLENALRLFAGSLQPERFLETVDPTLLSDIAQACIYMVPTRSDKLIRYIG